MHPTAGPQALARHLESCLESSGLDSFAKELKKARITSIGALSLHSIDQLEAALKTTISHAFADAFVLLGVKPRANAKPRHAAPAAEPAVAYDAGSESESGDEPLQEALEKLGVRPLHAPKNKTSAALATAPALAAARARALIQDEAQDNKLGETGTLIGRRVEGIPLPFVDAKNQVAYRYVSGTISGARYSEDPNARNGHYVSVFDGEAEVEVPMELARVYSSGAGHLDDDERPPTEAPLQRWNVILKEGTKTPKTTLPDASGSLSPVMRAMTECKLLVALLARCAPAEITVERLVELAEILTGKEPSFKDECDLADQLDLALERVVDVIGVEAEGLSINGADSFRAVRKLVRKLAEQAKSSSAGSPRKGVAGAKSSGGGSSDDSLAVALEAVASTRTMTKYEAENQEELRASKSRLGKVADVQSAVQNLKELADAQSKTTEPIEKLELFAQACKEDETLAELLHSSHVREPQGASSLTGGEAGACARAVSQVAVATVGAMRDVLRKLLPPNANAATLAKHAYNGTLGGKSNAEFRISAIVAPSDKNQSWLGTSTAATTGGKKSKPTNEDHLVTLISVYPAITNALALLHPTDTSIHLILAQVMGMVAKGLVRCGVEAAVNAVLAPLLETYELEWDAFQKGTNAKMPDLESVWSKVRAEASVQAYLSSCHIATAPASADSDVSKADFDKLKSDLGKAKKMAEKAQKEATAAKKASGMTDDEDEPSEKTLRNREKRTQKKAAKAAKKAGAQSETEEN